MNVTKCRLCESENMKVVIDLGYHPLADTFLYEGEMEVEIRYPLCVQLCHQCGHTMTTHVVPAIERYQKHDYSYDSDNSKVSREHFEKTAEAVISRLDLQQDDFVLDIGSNVGTLLSFFKEKKGVRVLGIEPAKNIAQIALKKNIPTLNCFLDAAATKKILEIGKPKAIVCTNVFNHMEDLTGFIEIIKMVLDDNGQLIIEVPYLLDLVAKTEFDTIYLEHVNYFAISPLGGFFQKHGLSIKHVERNDYMGGSIRIYIGRYHEKKETIKEWIVLEEKAGLFNEETYRAFMSRVKNFKHRLNEQLYKIISSGGKIVGIGAATKGNTLLNYCGIDSDLIEFITDASLLKIGKLTPGSHIKILGDQSITQGITHGLILPWNIANMLVEKLGHLNIKFLIPQMEKYSERTETN